MLTINLFDSELNITVPPYRGGLTDMFESYLLDTISPALRTHASDMFAIRCAITGFRIGMYLDSEIDAMLLNTSATLGITGRLNAALLVSQDDCIAAVQTIVAELDVRLVLLSKRSPLLAFQRDRLSLAGLDKPRQLAILLNMLLWDAGMLRDSFKDADELYSRMRRTFATADHVVAAWNESTAFSDLHAALIELDAKYSIRQLMFTQKESRLLDQHRDADSLDVKGLTEVVLRLTAYRDVHLDADLTVERWTQRAYQATMLSAASQEAKSNIVSKLQSGVDKKPGLKVPGSPAAKKAAKPVSEIRAAADSAVSSFFDNIKF